MQVCLGSIFRNAENYVQRYADQIAALRAALPQHTFRLILAEGDSVDQTYALLTAQFNGAVFKREHGGPRFGSTGEPERMCQHAFVWEAVRARIEPEDEVFFYLTSDLIWEPGVVVRLIERLQEPGVDLVSPCVFLNKRFYDTWGQRGMDGKLYDHYFPYHPDVVNPGPTGLVRLSSTGSFIAMKADVARQCDFNPPEMEVVSFTRNAAAKGFGVFLDPKLEVYHP